MSQTSRDKLLDATFAEVYRYGYHGASKNGGLKNRSHPTKGGRAQGFYVPPF